MCYVEVLGLLGLFTENWQCYISLFKY